jgi:signal transduction histidine kinase
MNRAVLFIVLALVCSTIVEWVSRTLAERDWDRYSAEQAGTYLAQACTEFTEIQRSVRRIAAEVALNPAVQRTLQEPIPDRTVLFKEATRFSDVYGVGVEIYSRSTELVAWGGRSGPAQRREVRIALAGNMTSFVARTPIEAQLFVVTPVREESGIIGAVLVRRLLETSTPFASRFLTGVGLTETLERELGVPVDFSFGENAEPSKDGRFASTTLYGIDSAKVGVVTVMRPARSEYFERPASRYHAFNAGLLIVLFGLVAAALWSSILKMRSRWIQSITATLLLWGLRYAFLFLDIPSSLLSGSLVDPTIFASQFGGGLAKSIGDLTFTVLVAAANVYVLSKNLLDVPLRRTESRAGRAVFVTLVLGIPLSITLFWALRGYAAAVQSAIYDSSLEYLNPRALFGSLGLSVMLLDLVILGVSFLTLSMGLVWAMARIAGAGISRTVTWVVWGVFGILLIIAAALFGVLGSNPLMSTEYRLLFGAGLLFLGYLIHRFLGQRPGASVSTLAPAILVFSAVLLYPLLSDFTRQHDRRRIETLAQEVLKPVDSWFSLVVGDGLQSFSSEEAIRIIESGDENNIGRLAYTRWIQSPACREGYTSIFTYFDSLGTVKSRFSIGGELAAATEVDTSLVQDNVREVTVKEIGRGINALKVYAGLIDIWSPDGRLLGFGQVTIAAAQQTLFRGETPLVLRTGSPGSLQSFYRPVSIDEFRGGRSQPYGTGIYPAGTLIPPEVTERLADSTAGPIWIAQTQGDASYGTVFFRRVGTPDEVVAISITRPRMADHVVGIVQVLIHVGVVGLLLLLGFLLPGWVRNRRISFTFRGRLMAAMLVTALLPLIVLTWYGGRYTADRLLEESRRTLDDETNTVASYILDQNSALDRTGGRLDQGTVEAIASEINTDFNVFVDGVLTATSRPELFDLGILDRRLGGRAYAAVVLQGHSFAIEREKIAQVEYAVGYRPLIDSSGVVAAVISVPTLFREERVEEEGTQRNAILFGVYAVVLLGLLVLATTLANRIASPIQELTAATKHVAGGDLDVRVNVPHADGELRQLIDSFETMTRDLKKSRDDLVRYERELAWKEMAKQVAHEIKNPLTPMKLSVQHLRQAFHDGAQNLGEIVETVSRTMIEQIETLSRIASEFSHFARMPRRKMEDCDVNAVLRESVQLFEQDRNVEFRLDQAEDLPPIAADREELRRAFINVLRNGMQAMEGKGRIEIETRFVNCQIRIAIRDHGRGIPEEMEGRLFQPNFSTKSDGMGLGLAIVKKTIDDLGGTVSLEPAPEGGTVAVIVIPIDRDVEA